jgi:hypothetical protein
MKKILSILLICWALFPIHSVLAASADTTALPVLSQGHIQDLGDYPADGSWVESPNLIGTVGQSKRIEGFKLKAGDSLPTDLELRYNVHVQNIGWLYDEDDPTSWAKNGDYAGTRGDGLRIEAIKIVLLDIAGNMATGYHIRYQGHVQNIGDLPADSELWFTDGEQLGTVGSSLRLEALKLEIVKDATTGTDLSAYTDLTNQIDSLNESDYSKTSWTNLQTVLNNHVVTNKNTTAEVADAVKAIEAAIHQLEKLSTTTAYDKPGIYGPSSGSETISQDVIITSTGVTLQNLTIGGNLIIDEAVGDGEVTLNNVTVTSELRIRGGGKNSIHINGGDYQNILVEKTATGAVRIVAAGLDGFPIVLSENAAGETLILEGRFDSVTVNAPDAVIKTQGQTSIKTFDVAAAAQNTAIDLGSTTTVTNLALSSPTKVTGTGTVNKAEIASDNVSFEKAPEDYSVDTGVIVPPVIPTPTPQPPTPQPPTPQPPTPQPPTPQPPTPPSRISLSVSTAPTVNLSKTYDGSTVTDVTNQIFDAAVITGIVAGDNVTVSATATYDNKNVGSNKDITITYSLSGTNAGKYNPPAATTIKGEITQKLLTGAATTAITKEFDGTTTLTTVITEDLGQLNADTLTITRTVTYPNIEVGTDKPVTCSYSLSGNDAGNYSAPAEHPATGTITTKNLAVSAASLTINKSKTYDGTTKVFNGTGEIAAGNNQISVATGVTTDPNINVTITAAYDSPSAGSDRIIRVSYEINSSPANKRYQITPSETLNGASITARTLTIAAPTPVAKAYDGTADVFTATNNTGKIYNMSIVPGNIAAADAGKVTVAATASYDTGKDAGTNKKITIHYTLAGEAAGNYQPLPDDRSKSATITPLTLNAGTVSEKTKEYDGSSTAKLNVGVSCSGNSSLFVSEAGKTLFSKIDSKYYTDSTCQTETSKPSDTANLYIKYTVTLEGTSAGNYVFADNKSSLTGTTNGGSITAKKLSVTADGMGLQTEKTYDGNTSTNVNGNTIMGGTGLTGIIGMEKVTATVSSNYDSVDAGDRNITTTFLLSGDDAGNYCIDPLNSSGMINPIQLEVDNTKLPAIAATRKYDATRDVYLTDNTTKLSDYAVSADAVSGLINNEAVPVKATANYDNKDVGENIPITITYSLSEEAAKNYLAPAPDISKTAAITPRILGYTNVNLDMIKKYKSGDSSVTVTYAGVDPSGNPDNGTDAIAHIAGSVEQEDVHLATYSADYYDGDQKTSAVGSNYDIKLSGSLTGNHASNYIMTDHAYSSNGQILNANAVISTPYNSTAWTPAGNLTPPAGVNNFKLFYAKQAGATTFYGYDSTGQIYSSTDLSTWITGEKVTLDDKQLIGIDSNGTPIALATTTTPDDNKLNNYYYAYYWTGSWTAYPNPLLNNQPSPLNPTYYINGNMEYLIYQNDSNYAYSLNLISISNPTHIGSNPGPSIPGGFKSSLLVYDGTNLMAYAY